MKCVNIGYFMGMCNSMYIEILSCLFLNNFVFIYSILIIIFIIFLFLFLFLVLLGFLVF